MGYSHEYIYICYQRKDNDYSLVGFVFTNRCRLWWPRRLSGFGWSIIGDWWSVIERIRNDGIGWDVEFDEKFVNIWYIANCILTTNW